MPLADEMAAKVSDVIDRAHAKRTDVGTGITGGAGPKLFAAALRNASKIITKFPADSLEQAVETKLREPCTVPS